MKDFIPISHQPWGNHEHKKVYLFRMENSSGAYVELSNYGAALVSIHVPDKHHQLGNVILGFPALEGYLDDKCYIGATIGRFANRIDKAGFVLDGKKYLLEDNDNGNSNHGGHDGFNSRVFSFSIREDTLSFRLLSEDGDGGFPGNLELEVSYRWTEQNELHIDYTAVTDRPTVANFTNHAYFNLTAAPTKIFGHELIVYSDLIVAADEDYIPTGLFVPAGNLSFKGNKLSEKLQVLQHEEKGLPEEDISGLNTCYFIEQKDAEAPAQVCTLSDPASGRVMTVFSSYPGLMLYTGDFLSSKRPGHQSQPYAPFDGLCLECQFLPDSPNHEHFPSTVLNPGDTYKQRILFKFSV